jgi:penicillin-binding protein 1A
MGQGVSRGVLRGVVRSTGRLTGLALTMGVAVVAITACLAMLGNGLGEIGSSLEVTPPKRPAFRELKERSVVFDRSGKQIAVFKSEENRRAVPLERVPKHLINAILDVEDANFYVHKGFNAKSTGRAMLQNLSSGEVEQGGSTITQQLVKIDLLTRAQKYDRKVREARLAMQLEKELSKDEILERYLNSVYFGGGAYGVEAAANHYFNKSVDTLDVPESAFIAGMIRNPTGYDPVRFRDRSRRRRTTVLSRMVAVGHLKQPEAEAFDNAPMPFPEKEKTVEQPSSYFVEQVKQDLLDDPRLGDTEGDRYQAVFNGGLRIFTTFDPTLQAAAEGVVAEVIPEKAKDEFTASLVSVDVASGAVRAMVAGRGFDTDQFNLATQARRQPGSSWKPFTLVAASAGLNRVRSQIPKANQTRTCPKTTTALPGLLATSLTSWCPLQTVPTPD